MWTPIIISVLAAFITAIATFAIQERKLKAELRTEFMAEQAAKSLLEIQSGKKEAFQR